ncbi:MAG TPA: Rrf2 family transcriptional regulator [Desulfobacteraceae bacterium]|nr:Rrf2 family transcriptional regulator [Desulfobacteraceae bacterium]HPJ66638.1 Rrf2 family transcriptional regulator [Desulfobacteraceae bacterium]HPQ27757.1 Rrf2 family transcriptional regulator [Desulfobacteraceae bacterium]
MLTKKAKYGLQAILSLARDYGKGPVTISDLAKREVIPKKFLESILLELKNRNILYSIKGKNGGYILAKPPNEISMGEVVRYLDGPLAPVPCVSKTAYRKCTECEDERTCGIRLVMKRVRDSIADILDGTSLEDVLNMITETRNEIYN